MIKRIIKDFDLQQVAASGQCFRMNSIGNDTYAVTAGNPFALILEKRKSILKGRPITLFRASRLLQNFRKMT